MRGLFLSGIKCKPSIWSRTDDLLSHLSIDYVEYPHSVTQEANSVSDLTKWVLATYRNTPYDFVVGHSMGGIIALELAADWGFACRRIILVDTNLKPANPFYRNLLTPRHMEEYGDELIQVMQAEAPYYREELRSSLQADFDYSSYVRRASQEIYAIYGDRGQHGYPDRIRDLCLDEDVAERISFAFVEDACHMPMMENPQALAETISNIVSGT
ncbi:alpha/beta fold hydrolase [Gorillibacterium timonense]|uniref:alpha/beta fold hydrolase n=1 Tax=Gorillibacterium timonense TaxID=1689269 RepID=UPI00071CB1F0|nr:alpha/beta hydrolase [Gorillibacterium timonense]